MAAILTDGPRHATGNEAWARDFLARPRMVAIATVGADGAVWAWLALGSPGFVRSTDDGARLVLDRAAAWSPPNDPLWSAFQEGAPVGLLAIELASRRRLRANGTVVEVEPAAVTVAIAEAYPNCPKHIQRRDVSLQGPALPDPGVSTGVALDAARRQLLARADTEQPVPSLPGWQGAAGPGRVGPGGGGPRPRAGEAGPRGLPRRRA